MPTRVGRELTGVDAARLRDMIRRGIVRAELIRGDEFIYLDDLETALAARPGGGS